MRLVIRTVDGSIFPHPRVSEEEYRQVLDNPDIKWITLEDTNGEETSIRVDNIVHIRKIPQ